MLHTYQTLLKKNISLTAYYATKEITMEIIILRKSYIIYKINILIIDMHWCIYWCIIYPNLDM